MASKKNITLNFSDNEECEQAGKRFAQLYQEDEQLARDEAMRSSSMFSMLLMLAAKEQGIETCPMTGCRFNELERLLDLDNEKEICMLISMGLAAPENQLRERKRLPLADIIRTI